jgi:hypothetical protein
MGNGLGFDSRQVLRFFTELLSPDQPWDPPSLLSVRYRRLCGFVGGGGGWRGGERGVSGNHSPLSGVEG